MCGMTSCVEPGVGKMPETYGRRKIYSVLSTRGVWNDVMRGTGGREKCLKPTGGEKFIASFPRKWAWRHAPRDWRVEFTANRVSSTTHV